MHKPQNISTITLKIEQYCAYQERCHKEVSGRLFELGATSAEADEIIVHLINSNFLNEERFAKAFARGKHRMKFWGRTRIINELKFRNISQYNINSALKEIETDYDDTFDKTAEKHWDSISETNVLKKRKKFCDFLLRKGYEADRVYEKAVAFERRMMDDQ